MTNYLAPPTRPHNRLLCMAPIHILQRTIFPV